MTRLILITALLASGSCVAVRAQQIDASDGTREHERAVTAAREGDYASALPLLEALHAATPQNRRYLNDLAATYAWAERDRDALALLPELDRETAPPYVLTAIAKAARNLRDYETAATWYREAIERDAGNLDAHVGLAMSLAEGQRYSEADAVFRSLTPEQRRMQPVLTAQAYIQRLGGQLIAALDAYEKLLESNPDDFDTLRGKALVLRDLLLPDQALEMSRQHPGILTDAEIARLQVDALAIQLRLAAKTVYPEELDGVLLDETIAAIDDHLAEDRSGAADLALRYDRIAALAERHHAREAASAFETLDVPASEMPAYVLAAAGQAYLQLQRPARATRLLERAVELPPVDIETKFALIYAYLDLDRYEDAMRVASATIAEEPLVLRAPDSNVVRGNDDRMRAEIVAAIADASIDQLDTAETRLQALLDGAPNNSDVRHELANVYRMRGWLDAALFEYDQVLTMDSSLVFARVGRAHTQIDRQHYAEAEATIDDLMDVRAPDPIVTQLARRWDLHNRSELLLEGRSGDSSGSTFGSSQYSLDAYWFTSPIRYSYRGFVHLNNDFSEFPEGDARRRRLGIGTQYRKNRWTASGEVFTGRNESDPGLAGEVYWRMTDKWQISGLAGINSYETQLRGHRTGVESNVIGGAATFARNESAAYSFGTSITDLSDGNTSRMLFGQLSRRLVTRPRSAVDLTASLSTSQSDDQNVAYFSPARDVTVLVGARHNWRIRRRYQRELTQRAEVQIGQYDQSGFSSGDIWRARYSLVYRLNDALSVELGAERSRNVYDGLAEHSTALLATVQASL